MQNKTIKQLHDEINQLQESKSLLELENSSLRDKLDFLDSGRINSTRLSGTPEPYQEISQLGVQLAEAKKDIEVFRTLFQNREKELKEAKDELAKHEYDDVYKQYENLKAKLKEREEEIANERKRVAFLEESIKEIKELDFRNIGTFTPTQRDFIERNTQLSRYKKLLVELKDSNELLHKKSEELNKTVEDWQRRCRELKNQIISLQDKCHQYESMVLVMEKQLEIINRSPDRSEKGKFLLVSYQLKIFQCTWRLSEV